MEKRTNLLNEEPLSTTLIVIIIFIFKKKQKNWLNMKLSSHFSRRRNCWKWTDDESVGRACRRFLCQAELLFAWRRRPRLQQPASGGRTDKRPSLRVLESARLPGQCNQPAAGGAKPLSHTFASKSRRAHCKRLFASTCSPWPGIMHWPFDPKIMIIIMMVLILIMLLWLVRLQPNRNKLFNLSQTEDLSFDLFCFFCASSSCRAIISAVAFFFP